MTRSRVPDCLDHMLEVAVQACSYVEGMRNRIAHGYFEINLDTVWDTTRTALPDLIAQLPTIRKSFP